VALRGVRAYPGRCLVSVLEITAYGRPVTQGSKTRTRWGMRDDNADTLRPWREAVKTAAIDAIAEVGWERTTAPVQVEAIFAFDRPAGHFGTGRNAGAVRDSAPPYPAGDRSGDLDKLLRAAFDALTDAGVWRSDAQVVGVSARKEWCHDYRWLSIPGARLSITRLLRDAHWLSDGAAS
jgi:Holliday junction resolvase RusA-like endonuclease